MVDPNRKINRFTDRDIEFLEECEKEFASRYTEDDSEFMDHCSKPLADPPILENFSTGSGGGGGGGGRSFQQNRWGNRDNRDWRGRGGGGGNRNRHHRRGGRGGGRYFGDQNGYDNRDRNPRYNPIDRPPMKIRRDYSNFVAASKDD